MMEPRLKTSIWVSALIRRAELGGAAAIAAVEKAGGKVVVQAPPPAKPKAEAEAPAAKA